MRWIVCLLLMGVQATPGDEPRVVPSPVRVRLDAASAVLKQRQDERTQEYERVAAEEGTDAAKAPKYDAAVGRYLAAVAPAVDALLDAVDSAPTDPAAGDALRFVTVEARGLAEQGDRALALLGRDHVRDPQISLVTGGLFLHHDKPAAIAFLRAVMADHPSRIERGRACHDLGHLFKFRVDSAERFRQRSPGAPLPARWTGADLPALRVEAAALLDRCLAEYADVPVVEFPGFPEDVGKTIADRARGELLSIRGLQIGMPAPEIAGQDMDGKPFRLSDYRGKVVVLVFSGQWCGPCRADAPCFRDLLQPETQRTNPCVVLEVDTDATPEPLRQAIADGEITWPCWFDGGTAGPITLAWGISSFPTIYVIDPQGVIRARDLRGPATPAAVARVLSEHLPAPQP